MKKKIIVLLFLVISSLLVVIGVNKLYTQSSNNPLTTAPGPKKEREEITDPGNSIYQSVVIVQDTTDKISYGTGIIVGENKLLTNVHVVSDTSHAAGEKINPNLVVRSRNSNGEFIDFPIKNITLAPNQADLAIVEVSPTDNGENIHDNMKIFELASLEEINNVKLGNIVHTVGYPVDKEYGTLWKSEGEVTFLDAGNFIAFNATITGGNSGSPIFNEDEKIIGLSNSGNDELAFGFLFSEELYEFIKTNIE